MKHLMSGNEAIARGVYEAGIKVASAYPGTPSTEILEELPQYKDSLYCEWAPNEKVATEVAYGASVAGSRSGMLSYVGTTDFRVICAKVVEGDPKFTEAYNALVYQLSKDIGAMAAVLHFDVDAIVYTAGMAYDEKFCNDITSYVGKLAPIVRLPGEEEMRSLAEGALRVLHGQQVASVY